MSTPVQKSVFRTTLVCKAASGLLEAAADECNELQSMSHSHFFPSHTSPVLLCTGLLLHWTTVGNLFKLQMLALFSLEVKQAAACS